MTERVTLQDVARQSGVSPATVSLVLRNKPGFSAETRQRVMETAEALGYRRRPSRGPLSGSALQRAGMLVKVRGDEPPQANPFYGPVMAGIEAACRRQHINLLYATLPVDVNNRPLEWPRMLLDDELDGLLLVGTFVDETVAELMQKRRKPIVLVDAYAAVEIYDSVVTDNVQGAYQATAYLIAQGHRHIGLVGCPANAYPSLAERRRGFLQALADHSLDARYFAESSDFARDVAAATTDLLVRAPEVSALFCGNDAIAAAVMQTAQALGRRLPGDLSVMGFDNIELAPHLTPALSTMQVDKVGMGRLGVQLLLNRTEFPNAGRVTAVVQPLLVVRDSVAAPISNNNNHSQKDT